MSYEHKININNDQLIKWRRELHKTPELGWSEFVTTGIIVRELKLMGFKSSEILLGEKVLNKQFVRGRNMEIVNKGLERAKQKGIDQSLLDEMDGYTGCVAIYDTGLEGPIIALRFDIDCVGVYESDNPNHLPLINGFKSTTGNHHACGHDGHMSIGLGIANWLMDSNNRIINNLTGKVKLLFQPAEEGVRGGSPMANSGIVDDVDYFLSSHIGFIAKSGEIVVNPTNFLCTTKYDFRFKGLAAHSGAGPHLGKNALVGACNAAIQMLAIPRHGDGMSRINVGTIKAGTGRNVIPDFGELQVEVRGETEEINSFMCNQVERIARGISIGFDLDLEIEIMGEAVDLINDIELVQLLTNVISTNHSELTVIPQRPFGGSEDATIIAKKVQKNIKKGKSIYFILGANLVGSHHQSDFDFDENQLKTGVGIYTECISELLKGKK